MRSILEEYDEATRAEERHTTLAKRARELRAACLFSLRSDGMTVRAIARLVELDKAAVRRLIKKAEVQVAEMKRSHP